MTDTIIEAPTFKPGDKFRYTGTPATDILHDVIRTGATGTIANESYPNDGSEYDGPRVYVRFDTESVLYDGYLEDQWFVSVKNIERLPDVEFDVEPEPAGGPEPVADAAKCAPGGRFEYTGNPWEDSLGFIAVRGSTGVILSSHTDGRYGPRWNVRFDHRSADSRTWVSERNITPLPAVPDAAALAAALTAVEAREAHAIERAAKAEQALEALRAKVVEVAREKAAEYDWCETVDAALAEMGLIEAQTTTVRATLIVEFDVRHVGELDEDKVAEVAESFATDRLSIEYVDGWREA